jgi:hypothetical protein
MNLRRRFAAFVLAAGISLAAAAADTPLLIQVQPDGSYKVWHTEGLTSISEDEILELESRAVPEGSAPAMIAAGSARAFDTPGGVVIDVVAAKSDRYLLVERDACGAAHVWHSEGPTALTNDQLTELVISAVPGGGKRVVLADNLYGKAFLNKVGIVVVLWVPGKQEPNPAAKDAAAPQAQ